MLYVVGMGAGSRSGMTIAAEQAILGSELIVGYTKYTELLRTLFPDKEYASTGMRQERERVELALKEAESRTVSQRRPSALRHGRTRIRAQRELSCR